MDRHEFSASLFPPSTSPSPTAKARRRRLWTGIRTTSTALGVTLIAAAVLNGKLYHDFFSEVWPCIIDAPVAAGEDGVSVERLRRYVTACAVHEELGLTLVTGHALAYAYNPNFFHNLDFSRISWKPRDFREIYAIAVTWVFTALLASLLVVGIPSLVLFKRCQGYFSGQSELAPAGLLGLGEYAYHSDRARVLCEQRLGISITCVLVLAIPLICGVGHFFVRYKQILRSNSSSYYYSMGSDMELVESSRASIKEEGRGWGGGEDDPMGEGQGQGQGEEASTGTDQQQPQSSSPGAAGRAGEASHDETHHQRSVMGVTDKPHNEAHDQGPKNTIIAIHYGTKDHPDPPSLEPPVKGQSRFVERFDVGPEFLRDVTLHKPGEVRIAPAPPPPPSDEESDAPEEVSRNESDDGRDE